MLECMHQWSLDSKLFEWVFAVEAKSCSKYITFPFREHVCFNVYVNFFLKTNTSQQMLKTEIGVFPILTHVARFFLHYC